MRIFLKAMISIALLASTTQLRAQATAPHVAPPFVMQTRPIVAEPGSITGDRPPVLGAMALDPALTPTAARLDELAKILPHLYSQADVASILKKESQLATDEDRLEHRRNAVMAALLRR